MTPRPQTLDPFVEAERRHAQTFKVGHYVKLAPGVGTKAMQNVVFRVTGLPDPTARARAKRDGYVLLPAGGGRGLTAEAALLDPATPAERAVAERLDKQSEGQPRLTVGSVVTTTARLRGMDVGTPLVVLEVTVAGTAKLAPLNGGGTYWAKVPVATLTRVTARV